MSAIDQIKEKLDIVELISASVQLRKTGRSYVGFCPFHPNTRTPAFTVYPETQSFHCFGCKASGTVFDFVMRKEGLDFHEALELLATRAGIELRPRTVEEHQADRERVRLLEITAAAATFYHHLLVTSTRAQPARDYLARRGVSREAVEQFQLGYAPEDGRVLLSYLADRRAMQPEDVVAAGLAVQREYGLRDMLRGRLVFPIRSPRGETLAFGGRALSDQQQPKYLNTPQTALFDKSAVLYGLDLAKDGIRAADAVVVVEGYLDVVTAHQYGFRNAVAPLGTALTDRHARLLNRLTRNIYLALDADAAGQRAMLKGLQVLEQNLDSHLVPVPTPDGLIRWERELNATIKIIAMPAGMDPDEVIKASPEQWQQLVAAALPVMDFYLRALTADLDLQQARGKADAVQRLGPLLSAVANPVEQAHYVQQLAGMLHVDEQVVRRALPGAGQRPRLPRAQPPLPPAALLEFETRHSREDYLLMLLLRYPSTVEAVRQQLHEGLARHSAVAELLPAQIGVLFDRVENRALWDAWLECGGGDVEAWAEGLPEVLRSHVQRILGIEEVRPQAYRYMNDALNCATILRQEQTRRMNLLLSQHYEQLPEGEERLAVMLQLVELKAYLNTLTAPPRSKLYNDWRDMLSVRGST